MITLEENNILLANLNYGKISSEVFWFPENKSSVEFLNLKENIFLLRGSKEYYITDIHGDAEFRDRYGSDSEDYHSRLASIGTFSDYLKKEVASFDLSVFYINSLSSGIVPFDASSVKGQARELEQELQFKQRKLSKLKFDQDAGIPVGREAVSLEAEVRDLKEKLRDLGQDEKTTARLESEYKSKGAAGTFIIRAHSPYYVCKENELQQTTSGILSNLQGMDNVVKNQAWQGFRIVIKEFGTPVLALATESIGLFDPRTLETLAKEYGIGEIQELKEEVEKLFVHRWAAPARIGETTYEKSAAIAQGIAYLMQKVAPTEAVSEIPEPDFKKLPTFKQKGKGLAYMGFTQGQNFQSTGFPYFYDLNHQGPMHTLIVGSSGSGKTVCAFDLAEGALIQGVPVLALDTTNQWTGFLKPCKENNFLKLYKQFQMGDIEPSGFPGRIYTPNSDVGINLAANLLTRPDVDRKDELMEYAGETAAVIKALCNLTDREVTYLRSAILEAWKANEFLDHANISQKVDQWGAKQGVNVTSSKLKLEGLGSYSFLFTGEGLKDISSLWSLGEITVVTLLHLRETQKLFCAYYMIRELLSYFYGQPDTEELKLLLVVEEVHRFIPKYTPDMPGELYLFLERAVRELRKKGVGLVFISQVMSDFRPAMRANTATKVWLRNGYDVDVDRASQDMGSAYSKHLADLKAGQAIVDFAEFGNPFFVQFRPPLHNPKTLSNEEIREEMASLRAEGYVPPEILQIPKREPTTPAREKIPQGDLAQLEAKFRAVPNGKIEALKHLVPEVYDLFATLGQIVGDKPDEEPTVDAASEKEKPLSTFINGEMPDTDLFLRKIKEFTEREGYAPVIKDIKSQLGWGDKKAFDIVEKLVKQGRVNKVEDPNDRRAKRLILPQ